MSDRIVATRSEDEPCERGTVGCCIAHQAELDSWVHGDPIWKAESSCETW